MVLMKFHGPTRIRMKKSQNHPGKLTAKQPKNHPNGKGTSSEPNLHPRLVSM